MEEAAGYSLHEKLVRNREFNNRVERGLTLLQKLIELNIGAIYYVDVDTTNTSILPFLLVL